MATRQGRKNWLDEYKKQLSTKNSESPNLYTKNGGLNIQDFRQPKKSQEKSLNRSLRKSPVRVQEKEQVVPIIQEKLNFQKEMNNQEPKIISQTFLPNTGSDQPLLAYPPKHIRTQFQEFESLSELYKYGSSQQRQDSPSRRDQLFNSLLESSQKEVQVYDCFDAPQNRRTPYFIDENERVYSKGLKEEFNVNKQGVHLNRFYRNLPTYYEKQNSLDDTLVFESRFESGNLQKAYRVDKYEYNLYLNPDTNTNSHQQCFYFRIQNTRKGQTYRFNINNLSSTKSQFKQGQKPLMYSEYLAETRNEGWYRNGSNINYFQNHFGKMGTESAFNTLSFEITFPWDNDTVYIANIYPYTYTDLCEYIDELTNHSLYKDCLRKEVLCKSIAGNDCVMLTITNFQGNHEEIERREVIVLSARVHPGENVSSFVIEGVIGYLLQQDDQKAQFLRNNFIFKIVPMLNADGVINGNQRSGVNGLDYNRQWSKDVISKSNCPEIFALKQMIKQLQQTKEIFMFCDFHGHSKQKSIFIYGCNNNYKPEDVMKERIFPLIYHKNCESFNFDSCKFDVQSSKESTARISVWRELNIINSFTLECSVSGPSRGKYKGFHFTVPILHLLGHDFCEALFKYTSDSSYVNETVEELRNMYPTINHLLNQDEGMFDQIAKQENDKIQQLLTRGSIRTTEVQLQPIKNDRLTNIRTKFEGEQRYNSYWFSCS